MKYSALSHEEEEIGKAVVSAAFKVHSQLGPGLLEKVYEACLVHKLRKLDLIVSRQVTVPIKYDGITFEEGLRLDILVEDKVIIEIKAVDEVNPVWKAQGTEPPQANRNLLRILDKFQCALDKTRHKKNHPIINIFVIPLCLRAFVATFNSFK